ncbi:bacteriorhodopsin [Bacillus sp. THAF10]|uniref:bacteriorhodopsin n=1 Tax=Bacillus sp. THAF10 TaxID=2587848 RepID=UPI001269367E|nr:bacteriorhodopsin [Bacillus sp. THAF10]
MNHLYTEMYPIEVNLLWFYVAVMYIAAVIFAVMGLKQKKLPRAEYLIAFIIVAWSGTAYSAMALGQGHVTIGDKVTYYARYLDWLVTTPLLLVALAFTAMHYMPKDKVLIGGLIAADVFMILTGLIADLSPTPLRYFWYGLGWVGLMFIMYIIWWPLRRKAMAQSSKLYRFFLIVAGYLTILWFGYPTFWILGPSGVHLFGQVTDTILFVFLPIFSKAGFSLIDLLGLQKLGKSSSKVPQPIQ